MDIKWSLVEKEARERHAVNNIFSPQEMLMMIAG
jgi:hypothetical protein